MSKITIYHNPRCSKSREALKIIEKKKVAHEIINYIENPIQEKELKKILKCLGMNASEIVRTKDKLFKDFYKNTSLDEKDYFDILIKHPTLMQRPIIVCNNKYAVIGRSSDPIADILKYYSDSK